ncbi:sensor histidine kinase [Aquabacterium sp. OR-4]|uniref:sensor histidine kinase n=1 Tax=Aquabacterium sp. OR-4 TaxID=2978127 RepID=UPI0028C787C7|nr:histidine kinase [Aquabacterium sp. OR-4]MDT7837180.1 histidine kinase [Aquabacterium sp. OR-4]
MLPPPLSPPLQAGPQAAPGTSAPAPAPAAPLDLPRLLMRRSAWVGTAVLLLALVLGLLRMADDMADEVDAAMALADTMAQLAHLPAHDDARALLTLRQVQASRRLRHLELHVHDGQGQLLLGPVPEPAGAGPMEGLLRLHRWLDGAADGRRVAWTVAREAGARWTVSLTASHESERREALGSLAGMLGLMLLCVAALLAAMRINLHHALRPLGRLVGAINAIELQDLQAVRALPTMPIRELESLAAALRHLAEALDAEQARRRQLSQQVLTLQEDERLRLARDLHDEFGQRLTAMRVDATWLGRRLALAQGDAQPAAALAAMQPVVAGLGEQCACIQQDIRALLARLQPFGSGQHGPADGAGESPERLATLLHGLVQGWSSSARTQGLQFSLQLLWRAQPTPAASADALPVADDAALAPAAAPGPSAAWPAGPGVALLPRALALVLYRITQEALTNVARHAQAQHAQITLELQGPPQPGAVLQVHWRVLDDGLGLADALAVASQRGNGLAGLRERVWALGGELGVAAASADPARPGLCLSASLRARWLAAPEADDQKLSRSPA